MLCLNIFLNNVKTSCNKLAIRSLASRRGRINKRNKEQEQYEDDSPLDDIQDADYVDLSKLEQSSKEMYRNVELVREREKYLIVKQKYFKNQTPNFLSWNEKMKIRNLYNKDPDEWSIDKLSESFPALPYVISSIAKSKWMKSNANKIVKHDETVERNWSEFRSGKLELPDDLVEHLNKFTSRQSNTLHLLESDLINVTPPKLEPPPNSFEAIIASYEKNNPKKAIEEGVQKKLLEAPSNPGKEIEHSNILLKNKETKTRMRKTTDSNEYFKKKREPIFTVPGFD